MSNDKNDESFDLLAHEKKISDLYQHNKRQQGETPSLKIDAQILVLAQQQLSECSHLEAKERHNKEDPSVNSTQPKKTFAWQWPFSLVASVGIMTVLLITQRDYFIHPNNVAPADLGISSDPIIKTPKVNSADRLIAEEKRQVSLPSVQMISPDQKDQVMFGQNVAAMTSRKSMSINEAPKKLKEQKLNSLIRADNSTITPQMSLADMTKLAEFLKLEFADKKNSGQKMHAADIEIQQSLFENLLQYQKSHKTEKLSEDFFKVLTEKQIQQLQSLATEAVPEN